MPPNGTREPVADDSPGLALASGGRRPRERT
jgi:hypothetical protein